MESAGPTAGRERTPRPQAPPLGLKPRPCSQSPPDLSLFNNPTLVPLSFPAPLALPSSCNPVP